MKKKELATRLAAAERLIEAVKLARGTHPACDAHPDDGPVSCGWKLAVIDIDAALAPSGDHITIRRGDGVAAGRWSAAPKADQ